MSASFVYSVEPKASVNPCNKNPVGDATACYALETKHQGSISVYAWYQRKTCRVRKWKLRCYVSKIHVVCIIFIVLCL